MKKKDVALVFKGADDQSWKELLDDLRPKGSWIKKDSFPEPYAKCSLCGAVCEIDNFCGNCGAAMML